MNSKKVNAQGQEIQWERRQAEYFTEDLGNSVTEWYFLCLLTFKNRWMKVCV
ncbi:hypothetical protein [Brasilonema sp. UFV-L1]|uniref:hypothetical protein n=1 Tax=Brasilonema sp. UFV-L1 TaxID=2234130 RepID=UPI0030DA9754